MVPTIKKSFASYPTFTDPRHDLDVRRARKIADLALFKEVHRRFKEENGVEYDDASLSHAVALDEIWDELELDPRYSTENFMPQGDNRASYGELRGDVVREVNRDYGRKIDDIVNEHYFDEPDVVVRRLEKALKLKNRNNRIKSAKAAIQKAAVNYMSKGRGDAGMKLMERSRYFNTLPPELAQTIGAMAGTRVVTAARRLPKYLSEGGVDTKPQRKRPLSDAVPEIHAPTQRKRGNSEGGVDTKPQRKRPLSDAVPEIHVPTQRKRGKA